MSTLKVDNIRHNNASSDAITMASDGTCTAKLTSVGGGQLSNRNIIVNGACLISQRGTSATGLPANGFATVDRFRADQSGTDNYIEQHQVDVASGTTPYTLGFRKAFQIKNGNQTSGAGTSDRVIIMYRTESQDLANSGWNYTSSSSHITFSFYVKSSVAQNFYVNFKTYDGTGQGYAMETGSLSANTWTKVTKTIPGNSNLQFDNDANTGLEIEWTLYRGTATTGSKSLNTWAAFNSSDRIPDMDSTWYTTDDATFEITGIQLEVGDTVTSFEHLSFTDDLRRCQRYFYMHASGIFSLSNTDRCPIGLGYGYTSTDGYVFITYPVQMRAYPSLFKVVGSNYFNFAYNNNNAYPDNLGINRLSSQVAEIYFYQNSSWDQNASGMLRTYNTAARLGFSAEL